jgi:hypothetical protein
LSKAKAVKRTLASIAEITAGDRLSPLDVMLAAMNRHYHRARAIEAAQVELLRKFLYELAETRSHSHLSS